MRTVLHLNLRVDPTQYIPQIRNVPGYDYIHLVRQPKHLWDLSLLNDKVYYLSEIHSYKEFVEQHNIALIHAITLSSACSYFLLKKRPAYRSSRVFAAVMQRWLNSPSVMIRV